ncbi:hypothetical protein [Flavobacterium sp. S87F.05.LMB.W.Kidney.N]|uniref:hypothetical protein n=1 Tax=Flavobacterium sp. S87F.05.LMB.W.Kidney.N TaxID=1278758 RepID=UPI001064AE36|nr:hypothetical protein [Flavobacterium sp. S87F.05.LMB.W.Kidney.N]TDX10572.1 hypothetical protein EDB96_2982 [Flavobacterium sp. S87F.05.LMB.W.Kidney.N]
MSKKAQFVVIIMETASWMESQAQKFYAALFPSVEEGERFAAKSLSISQLFKVQNDFNIEVLMVYENENPSSFLQLNSSRIFNENIEAEKPICVEFIIYSNPKEILLLTDRAEVIAKQRKNDLIWVKLFKFDVVLKETLESNGYEKFDFEENETTSKQIYLKKSIPN